MADLHLRNVEHFHRVFGCPIRQFPGFYVGPENYHRFVLQYYVQALAEIGEDLKVEAERQNIDGYPGLGALLTRLQLHVEETAELADAFMRRDIVDTLDALTDIDYVTNGTHLAVGTAIVKSLAHLIVHESNLSKLGPDDQPIVNAAGRVVKGPNYEEPKERLRKLLSNFPT